MPGLLRSTRPAWGGLAALLLLLATLAALQFRWLDRVRASDEARARAALAATARGVAADVARELADLHHHFAWTRDPGARTAAAGLADWRRQSVHPDLVQGLLRRERTADGGLIWHALDEATGAWDTQIPEEVRRALETAQDLADGEREVVGRRGRTGPFAQHWLPTLPALLIPDPPPPGAPPAPPQSRGALLVLLDGTRLAEQIIAPALTTRGGDGELPFAATVFDGSGAPVLVVPNGTMAFEDGDLSLQLLAPQGPRRSLRRRVPDLRPSGEPDAGWRLVLRHPAGSVRAAVARAHRANLALGTGILLIAAAAGSLLLVSSLRERRLAQRQIDFAAAVSHELRTPLTAITQLGQNLADGLVEDIGQVRRYGELIGSEGRRLGATLEQILALAGVTAQRPLPDVPVDLAALVPQVLQDAAAVIDEQQAAIRLDLPAGLPPARGDADALRRAILNLVVNACLYGGDPPRIEISLATRSAPASTLLLQVRDHGPGIPAALLDRLFEPFERGAEARRHHRNGAGLGLALAHGVARAHGGSLHHIATPGGGATFELELPAAGAPRDAISL